MPPSTVVTRLEALTMTQRRAARVGFAVLTLGPFATIACGEGSELPDGSVVIPSLPFIGTGDTSDNLDDYDAVCPWESTSPDVFYQYTHDGSSAGLSIDMCKSNYDTKIFVLDEAFNVISCDDDSQTGERCIGFASLIDDLLLDPGETVYIAVDGWSGDAGFYAMEVTHLSAPCLFSDECPPGAQLEGEFCAVDVADTFNGGCNSTPVPLFSSVECGDTICGQITRGDDLRDTDWFALEVPADADVTMTGIGEFNLIFGRIEDSGCTPGAPDCSCIGGTIDPFVSPPGCTEASVTSAVAAGTSWWFVSTDQTGAIACAHALPGNEYVMTWTCGPEPCCVLGDSNHDGAIDFADLVILLANWGPCGG